MPRKRQPGHHYSVYILAYADAATKERAEAGEHIIQPEQLGGQLVHRGNNLPRADAAFARAVRMAISDPLAYAVEVVRDGEVVVRVLLDRRR